jgi:hypothetical protein
MTRPRRLHRALYLPAVAGDRVTLRALMPVIAVGSACPMIGGPDGEAPPTFSSGCATLSFSSKAEPLLHRSVCPKSAIPATKNQYGG